jgi:hypothetical protein
LPLLLVMEVVPHPTKLRPALIAVVAVAAAAAAAAAASGGGGGGAAAVNTIIWLHCDQLGG